MLPDRYRIRHDQYKKLIPFPDDTVSERTVCFTDVDLGFTANQQFRLFDELVAVPAASQLVYKFTATNPLYVILRTINIWAGGRKYTVVPADGNETYDPTGEVDISDQLYPTNGVLSGDLITHPATGVTVTRNVGAGIFSSTSKPRNGTAVLTDGNQNRASSAYTANGDRGGVAGGQSFYLVFDHIGSSNATDGLFMIVYNEEIPT